MKTSYIQLSVLLMFTLLASSVNAALITFDEGGDQSNAFASQEPLDTEYAAQGVNFSGGWERINQGGNFGVDALSGNNFAGYNIGVSGISNTLTVTFDFLVGEASGFLGTFRASDWVVTALLDGDIVSELNLANLSSSYTEFSLSGLAFNQLEISGSASYGVLDDLSYEVASVPEPSTLMLFGLGLAGLVLSRRRKS